MKNTKNEPETEEIEVEEDWCFGCKDGGDLIVCDHKGCLKVYHAHCVEDGCTSLNNSDSWSCARHKCFGCRKPTKRYCFCCPNAICGDCDSTDMFAPVGKKGGICHDCMKYILLIEENRDCDSDGDGGKIDFGDTETWEGLFKEYWLIVKEKEGLTLEDVYNADTWLKKGTNYRSKSGSAKVSKDDEDTDASLSDTNNHDEEDNMAKKSRGRKKKSMSEKKNSGVVEFDGWGSKPLISFLSSIGKDTGSKLSRCDVDSIISRYIHENNLFEPGRKKKVVCDEKLYSVFKKKKINKHKIYSLLEPHFIESAEFSDEEEKEDACEAELIEVEKEAKNLGISKQQKESGHKRKNVEKKVARPKKRKEEMVLQRKSIEKEVVCRMPKEEEMVLQRKSIEKEVVCRMPKEKEEMVLQRKSNENEVVCKMPKEKKVVAEVQGSFSAAISVANIKLIYLRRSLVEELSKQMDTAKDKIVGSFVKVKTDPLDCQQRCSHQLVQVTGIKHSSTGDINTEVLLEVSNIPQAISFSRLSDADLSEEDCEELQQRVENGLIQKPTVGALLQKAKTLHVDITKHWIVKELARLKNLIEQANEKGRRKELYQYLEQRTLLNKTAEQERLLKQQPKVFPELLQTKPPPSASLSSGSSSASSNDSESEESS